MKTKVTINGVEYSLDLEKAKELGILKEKDARCKSWEEFREKYKNYKGCVVMSDITDDNECYFTNCPIRTSEQLTKEEAIAISAFSKLLKLRRDWIGEWNPDWKNAERKYCIAAAYNRLTITSYYFDNHTFSFPTIEMAREFLECFKNLIEDCKELL
jgi:exonuclease III